jgi:Astacin (Peptidase family M12A)
LEVGSPHGRPFRLRSAKLYNAPDCGNNPKADIRVDFKDKEGNYSYVGVESRLHSTSMNFQNFTEALPEDKDLDRSVGHETGHAIGLEHEHQNPSAPNCDWNYDYIRTLRKWTSEQEMRDNFAKLQDYIYRNRHAYVFSTYDPKSLMHYAFNNVVFNDGDKDPCIVPLNYVPSDQDKNAIRVAYGPSVVALQVRMKELLPDIAKAIPTEQFTKLQPLLQAKADLLNE